MHGAYKITFRLQVDGHLFVQSPCQNPDFSGVLNFSAIRTLLPARNYAQIYSQGHLTCTCSLHDQTYWDM